MNSFIDLMAGVVWSDADIANRVTQIIRASYSPDDELKAARLARKPDKSADDAAYIAAVDVVITDAIKQGRAARADMALLRAALDYEAAQARLAFPVVAGPTLIAVEQDGIAVEVPNPALQQDADERSAAQEVLDAAAPEVLALVALRATVEAVDEEVAL